jgi:hypothetical protein
MCFGSTALAAYLTSLTTSTSTDTADATDLTSSAKAYVSGLSDSTIAASGLFEPLFDTPVVAALAAADGTPVSIAPAGFAPGSPVVMVSARETSYDISAAVDAVVAANVNVQGDGRLDRGVSLVDLGQVTAAGNGGAVDGSASSSNGGLATLHVTACTGTLIVKVQHSANGTTGWADLATFATATGATSQRVTFAGSVNRYMRASWTLTGASAAATFTTSLARR